MHKNKFDINVYENVAIGIILKTDNVTHGEIELIMIIVIELNRETSEDSHPYFYNGSTDTEIQTINKKHRN